MRRQRAGHKDTTLRLVGEERRGFPTLGDAHKSEMHALMLVQARYSSEILGNIKPSLSTTTRRERDELGWNLTSDSRRHWTDPYLFLRNSVYLGVAITKTTADFMGGFSVLARRALALAKLWSVSPGWLFPTLVSEDMGLASLPDEKNGTSYTDFVLVGVEVLKKENMACGITEAARSPEQDEWRLSDVAPRAARPLMLSAIADDLKEAYRPRIMGIVPAWIMPLLMSDAFHDKHVYDPLGRANAMRVAEAIRGVSLDLLMRRVPMDHSFSNTMLDRCIAFLTHAPSDLIQELLVSADRQKGLTEWKMQSLLEGFTSLKEESSASSSALLAAVTALKKTTDTLEQQNARLNEHNELLQRQNESLVARVEALEAAQTSVTGQKRKR